MVSFSLQNEELLRIIITKGLKRIYNYYNLKTKHINCLIIFNNLIIF